MPPKVSPSTRAAIISDWRRARGVVDQRDFLAAVAERHGVILSARTLRAWAREADFARPDHHVDRLRALALRALDCVHTVEAELQDLVGNLDLQPATVGPAPLMRDRSPATPSAAAAPAPSPQVPRAVDSRPAGIVAADLDPAGERRRGGDARPAGATSTAGGDADSPMEPDRRKSLWEIAIESLDE